MVGCEALIYGKTQERSIPTIEVELHPIHPSGELALMLFEELRLTAEGFGFEELLHAEGYERRALIIVVGIVCDVEVDLRRIDDKQFALPSDEFPSLGQDGAHDDGVAKSLTPTPVGELTGEHQIARSYTRAPVLGSIKGEAKGITSGLIAVVGETNDLHISAEGAVEALGAIGLSTDVEGLLTHPFGETEASAVATRRRRFPPP